MKETVVSEAAREAADAEAAAREMQAAMNIPPVENAEKAASGTADAKDEKPTEEEERKRRGIVRMHVELWSVLLIHHLHRRHESTFADPAGCSP